MVEADEVDIPPLPCLELRFDSLVFGSGVLVGSEASSNVSYHTTSAGTKLRLWHDSPPPGLYCRRSTPADSLSCSETLTGSGRR